MTKNYIYKLDSDSSILENLSNWMLNREIEQKFIYQWKWAKLYYEDKSTNPMYVWDSLETEDFINMWNNEIKNEDEKIAFISLWCWNSQTEYNILNQTNTKNVDYFWIDASDWMLELTHNMFKKLDCNYKLISSDFTSRELRFELEQLTKKYDKKIFTFFSNTFWNIQHTKIIDILYNLLNKWDKIWIDVRLRKWTNVKDDLDVVNTVARDLHREETIESYTRTLIELGVWKNDWELKMKSMKEASINALKCQFLYEFKNKSTVSIKWDEITILPWESIKLLIIYIYDSQWLINFFEEHWFNFIKKQIKWYRGQFLFEKR